MHTAREFHPAAGLCGLARASEGVSAGQWPARDEPACRPGSVSARLAVQRSAAIHLGPPLPVASCGLPASSGGPPSNTRARTGLRPVPLLDLAPGGVYLAAPVARNAGGLLHHRFTLTACRSGRRFVLCGTVPRVTPGGCCPPPCPVEPGPSSTGLPAAAARPAHPGTSVRVLASDLEADGAGADLGLGETSAYVGTERQVGRRASPRASTAGSLHDEVTTGGVVLVDLHDDRVEAPHRHAAPAPRPPRGRAPPSRSGAAVVGDLHRLGQRVEPVSAPRTGRPRRRTAPGRSRRRSGRARRRSGAVTWAYSEASALCSGCSGVSPLKAT